MQQMQQVFEDSQGLPVKFLFNEKTNETIIVTTDYIEYIYKDVKHIIPIGFDSDGASIPRFAWRMIGHPFDMKYLRQGVFHDWLYRTQIMSRHEADKMLYSDTKGRLCWLRRVAMYLALRAFGWVAWNNHKKALNNKQENNNG